LYKLISYHRAKTNHEFIYINTFQMSKICHKIGFGADDVLPEPLNDVGGIAVGAGDGATTG
jgi:hypothetical protein